MRKITVFCLFLFTVINTFGQIDITGKITDENGEPLIGVNVYDKNARQGTVTDVNGDYSISVGSPESVLSFSFIGYTEKEVEVGDQTTINVQLEPTTETLDDVIVVGYGAQKKETVTGSITTASGEELQRAPVANFTNSLAGKMPGVFTVTRSGEPGYDGATIRIRGNNTLDETDDGVDNTAALVVVDGVPGRDLQMLDPADIESVSVLKDASAAIYGSRGANGVILVTTKRGSTGKPTIKVDYDHGFTTPTVLPEMADAVQYLTMLQEIAPDPDIEADLEAYATNPDPWLHPNTDWFEETLKKWSAQRSVNASVSGGTENVKYYLSLGGNYQDAIYKNSATNASRYNLRANIDGNITENIDIGFDISARQENRNFPTRSRDEIFRMIMRGKPNMHAFWPTGEPGPDIEYGNNPVVVATDATGYDEDKRYKLLTNLRLGIDIPFIKGLSLTGNVSFDKNMRHQKTFRTPWYLYTLDEERYLNTGEAHLTPGQRGFNAPELNEHWEDQYDILANGRMNYNFSLAQHSFGIMAGIEMWENKYADVDAFREQYISDQVDYLFAGSDAPEYMTNNGTASEGAKLDYFGRFNYDFAGKYLLEFIARYDGSFNFPNGKRYGFFPSVSVGWRVSEENFWKNNISAINYFKLRTSYGQTGNDQIGAFQYLSNYAFSDDGMIFYEGGVRLDKTLYEQYLANPNVTWEVANQFNVGMNMQFMQGMFELETDYFNYKRDDILLPQNASVPQSAGLAGSLPAVNIGKVSNHGFEFEVTHRNRVGDFRYSVSLNGSYAQNQIDYWDEPTGAPEYQWATGHPMGTALRYTATGIFRDQEQVDQAPYYDIGSPQPGDIMFEDYDGNDTINALDRTRIDKSADPTTIGGLNLNLGYKQFDLNILFQGAAGAIIYLQTESGEIGNYLRSFAENRWTEDNPDASEPRTFNRDNEYWRGHSNTHFVHSTDYIRLKNIEFGYTLPDGLNNRMNIGSLRIYFSGLNLLTFSKFKEFDPELNNSNGRGYPLTTVYNLGITLTL